MNPEYTLASYSNLAQIIIPIADFMPQFEVGQQELIDLHHYTYLMDLVSMGNITGPLAQIVYDINDVLVNFINFSTQNRNNYHKMMDKEQFVKMKKYMNYFQKNFLTVDWFTEFIGLGFSPIDPKEKEINSLTQTGKKLPSLHDQLRFIITCTNFFLYRIVQSVLLI